MAAVTVELRIRKRRREKAFSKAVGALESELDELRETLASALIEYENRLESTLQSVRRKVIIRFIPDEAGYLISVEAFKELEDLDGLAANSAGGATFQEHTPLQRDLNAVVGQTVPSGWIPLGRDPALEQDLLRRLQVAFLR